MKKILFIILCLLVMAVGSVFAQSNSLTFSTYYPAPYGAYDRLRLVPYTSASPLPSPCEIGTMYVRQTGTSPNETSELRMCRNDGEGSGEWVPFIGVWTQSGDNIYLTDFNPADPNNPDLSVGIGTASPASKLHVSGGAGAADVLIEADTDDDGDEIPSLTLKHWQEEEEVRGRLYFDGYNLRLQAYHSSSSLQLLTGTSVRMTIDPDGRVGINDASPESFLEISGDGTNTDPYFMLSSDDDTDGDILRVDKDGNFIINFDKDTTPDLFPAKLVLTGEGDDVSQIGFGGNISDVPMDIMYDGGGDGVVTFNHLGGNLSDAVVFNHYSQGGLVPLAKIRNDGVFYAADKLAIGVDPDYIHDSVELHVHETSSSDDVTVVLSDEGTNTGFSDPNFPYITSETIGVLMPQKSLTAAGTSTSLGGLQIVGISDGDATTQVPGLNLVGAVGNTDPENIPAVDITGYKIDSNGDIALLNDDDITMGVNAYSGISNSYFMVTADGRVGIGFEPFDNNRPTQTLHVNGLARLEPMESAPTSPYCPANGDQNGSIYADKSGALCFCHAGQWYVAAGNGSCD